MPGVFLHQGAIVQCAHQGMAQPTLVSPRVKVMGQPVAVKAAPYTVAGCTLPPPPAANGPCVTGQFVLSALRVKADRLPVLLFDSQAVCAPTGTPLTAKFAQQRVKGQ